MKYLVLVLALAVLAPSPIRANDELSRDEVALFQKRLITALNGLGAPPAGYARAKDDFVLPTTFSKSAGKINAVTAAVSRSYARNGVKNALDGQANSDSTEPISVRVTFNEAVDEDIDPVNVVIEKPGVLGLKYKNGGEEDPTGTVKLFFQPSLKGTKKLSRVKLFSQGISVPAKTSVGTVILELTGIVADVENWAKRVNVEKILAVIDAPAK